MPCFISFHVGLRKANRFSRGSAHEIPRWSVGNTNGSLGQLQTHQGEDGMSPEVWENWGHFFVVWWGGFIWANVTIMVIMVYEGKSSLFLALPSGNLSQSYGKSPSLMGKRTMSMAIFHSYVKLPEGNSAFTQVDASHVDFVVWNQHVN